MTDLGTRTAVAAAEGDIALVRVHVKRLAPGYVKAKMEKVLRDMENEVEKAGAALASSSDFVVVDKSAEMHLMDEEECASDGARAARTKLERALDNGEGPRPSTPHEAVALGLHALIACKESGYPGLRCIGVPKASSGPTVTGFAAAVRDLDVGKLVPPTWKDHLAFKYRREGFLSAEVFELRCQPDGDMVEVRVSSVTRGLRHDDRLLVDFQGLNLPARKFDELAAYVRDLITPKIAPDETPSAAPRVDWEKPPPRPPPQNVAPRGPRFDCSPPPFFDGDDHMLVGPSHPMFGRGPPNVAAPRYDPIVPGDFPAGGPSFPGPRAPPRGPRVPGEPNFDHLKPPGPPSDDSMFL